jgi:hypothetical protein
MAVAALVILSVGGTHAEIQAIPHCIIIVVHFSSCSQTNAENHLSLKVTRLTQKATPPCCKS